MYERVNNTPSVTDKKTKNPFPGYVYENVLFVWMGMSIHNSMTISNS